MKKDCKLLKRLVITYIYFRTRIKQPCRFIPMVTNRTYVCVSVSGRFQLFFFINLNEKLNWEEMLNLFDGVIAMILTSNVKDSVLKTKTLKICCFLLLRSITMQALPSSGQNRNMLMPWYSWGEKILSCQLTINDHSFRRKSLRSDLMSIIR